MAPKHNIVVLGAGIGGLTAALLLAQDGHAVTVAARDLPGDDTLDWASPRAGAAFFFHVNPDRADSAHDIAIQKASFKHWWTLAHDAPNSGVAVMQATEYHDNITDDSTIWYRDLAPNYAVLPKSSLPPGVGLGLTYNTLAINPPVILSYLQDRLQALGVTFIRDTVPSLSAAQAKYNPTHLINCTGLGSRTLANDTALVPVRGQTLFVKAPHFNRLVIRQGGAEYTMAIPRPLSGGGVILGGVRQVGSTDAEVDGALRGDILTRIERITQGELAGVSLERDLVKDVVGFRPERKGGPRIEVEGNVVHAYGYGGMGYIYSFGAAEKVRELVKGMDRARL